MAGTGLAAALQASLLAGFVATTLGALPVLAMRRLSLRASSALSGFAAGVMLTAAFVSLLFPAFELARAQWASAPLVAGVPLLGLLVGAGALGLLDAEAPHAHFVKGEEGHGTRRLRRTTLVVIAIAIHNFPEGFAVGAGVGAVGTTASASLAIGIALQNAPEGLVVATSLLRERRSRGAALAVAGLTGLVEPVGSAFGWAATSLAVSLLPAGLGFAAGAMLYVVSGEVIPESHRGEGARAATWGTMVGIAVMMALNALAP